MNLSPVQSPEKVHPIHSNPADPAASIAIAAMQSHALNHEIRKKNPK